MLQSDGYKYKCDSCGFIFFHLDDYCPECGSDKINEQHLVECNCKDCKECSK